MSGLAFTSLDDGRLRERLSLEIIGRRDFSGIGVDGVNNSFDHVSVSMRPLDGIRLAAPVTSSSASGAYQFSVSTVDELGFVHTSPLVTTPLNHLLGNADGIDIDMLDVHCPSPSIGLLNHAFLCMEMGSCKIGPQLVNFLNNRCKIGPKLVNFLNNRSLHDQTDGVGSSTSFVTAPIARVSSRRANESVDNDSRSIDTPTECRTRGR